MLNIVSACVPKCTTALKIISYSLSSFFSIVGGDSLSSGSIISVPDLVEGEIFVPPPPSMAPPPPPGTFIPTPSDFMSDLNNPDLENLKPPSMPAPKPISMSPSMGEEDFTFLKPPPMAPPKPPSICSSGSTSSLPISSPPPDTVPEPPKFSPPQPPSEGQHKTYKTPPPKPNRLSSISTFDPPPQTPAPPPPVQTPTLSTFNPQNTAKLYSIPKTSILSGYEDRDTRPKQMLLLEDVGSVKSAPVLVQVDGKAPKMATPSKPVSKDVQELKDNLHLTKHSPSPLPEPDEVKTVSVSAPLDVDKSLRTPHQTSPQPQKVNSTWVNSESSKGKLEESPSQSRKFSPILDRKLRNLKISETNAAREGPAASPLALLMAAKEREKHRSSQFLSQENRVTKNEQPSASIHPSDSSPNSFIVTPRSSSSSSLTSQNIIQENPKSASTVTHTQIIRTPQKSSSPALVKDQMQSASLNLAESPSTTYLVTQTQNASPPKPQSTQHEDDKEELSMPLLPPPPGFDDLDETMGPPPIPPPDPPMKKAPTQNVSFLSPAQDPSPLPKPKPPEAPKLPPPDIKVKPKPQVQTKPKVISPQLPSTLSPGQATLLSILQKKMLEMDHKMSPVKEAESSSDDWGTPLSDENDKIPVVPRATPQRKNDPVVNKAATLDMRELEGKVVRKYQETSSVPIG